MTKWCRTAPHRVGRADGGILREILAWTLAGNGTTVEDVCPVGDGKSGPRTLFHERGAAAAHGLPVVVRAGRGFMPDLDTWDPVLGSRAAIGGGWALPTSLYWVSRCRAALPPGTPIVGTNGARSGLDVARFLLAGATAVEVATVLFERGPEAITDMVTDLTRYADDHGVQRIQDLVGVTTDRSQHYGDIQPLPPERRQWPWSKYLQGD